MLDRTRNRVGHGMEREVGDRKREKRGKGEESIVVCYHAHCSIDYLACCADMVGIVISCKSEVKNC